MTDTDNSVPKPKADELIAAPDGVFDPTKSDEAVRQITRNAYNIVGTAMLSHFVTNFSNGCFKVDTDELEEAGVPHTIIGDAGAGEVQNGSECSFMACASLLGWLLINSPAPNRQAQADYIDKFCTDLAEEIKGIL